LPKKSGKFLCQNESKKKKIFQEMIKSIILSLICIAMVNGQHAPWPSNFERVNPSLTTATLVDVIEVGGFYLSAGTYASEDQLNELTVIRTKVSDSPDLSLFGPGETIDVAKSIGADYINGYRENSYFVSLVACGSSVALFGNGESVASVDAGLSWQRSKTPVGFTAACFDDGTFVSAFGADVLFSKDGLTWQAQAVDDSRLTLPGESPYSLGDVSVSDAADKGCRPKVMVALSNTTLSYDFYCQASAGTSPFVPCGNFESLKDFNGGLFCPSGTTCVFNVTLPYRNPGDGAYYMMFTAMSAETGSTLFIGLATAPSIEMGNATTRWTVASATQRPNADDFVPGYFRQFDNASFAVFLERGSYSQQPLLSLVSEGGGGFRFINQQALSTFYVPQQAGANGTSFVLGDGGFVQYARAPTRRWHTVDEGFTGTALFVAAGPASATAPRTLLVGTASHGLVLSHDGGANFKHVPVHVPLAKIRGSFWQRGGYPMFPFEQGNVGAFIVYGDPIDQFSSAPHFAYALLAPDFDELSPLLVMPPGAVRIDTLLAGGTADWVAFARDAQTMWFASNTASAPTDWSRAPFPIDEICGSGSIGYPKRLFSTSANSVHVGFGKSASDFEPLADLPSSQGCTLHCSGLGYNTVFASCERAAATYAIADIYSNSAPWKQVLGVAVDSISSLPMRSQFAASTPSGRTYLGEPSSDLRSVSFSSDSVPQIGDTSLSFSTIVDTSLTEVFAVAQPSIFYVGTPPE
jgi:hypothetical protein